MSTLYDRRFIAIAVMAIGFGFLGLLQAATPSSGTVNTPPDNTLGTKQTLTFTAGPFAAGSLAGTPCMYFRSRLPSQYRMLRRHRCHRSYATHAACSLPKISTAYRASA
jgi:hypothetical protein